MLGKNLRRDAHFEQRTSTHKPLPIPGPLRGSQVEVEMRLEKDSEAGLHVLSELNKAQHCGSCCSGVLVVVW